MRFTLSAGDRTPARALGRVAAVAVLAATTPFGITGVASASPSSPSHRGGQRLVSPEVVDTRTGPTGYAVTFR
jgi:hypothetical protein